ncbi:prepilin-type N-terminal cleavage/methylation domain-containing protein, partial [Listeria monocytogenes]|nr:prepilin-type N-terminal cleavage/methylation domain-containing protein [Listeria monocytogenes]EAG2033508.1 prepilin-type N-terminal cleavage/methylation domain-containing protein [Listeria monocytogenes]ECP7754193.1 prepilin-type N-terminal cleavage/methylation domain-containing protein [Listeria monocytogenes]
MKINGFTLLEMLLVLT